MTPSEKSREEFRAYMKAANPTSGNQDDRHLSEAFMIAYYRGEMSDAEREAAEAHLVACEPCIALFRNASDFLEPARADEEEVKEESVAGPSGVVALAHLSVNTTEEVSSKFGH